MKLLWDIGYYYMLYIWSTKVYNVFDGKLSLKIRALEFSVIYSDNQLKRNCRKSPVAAIYWLLKLYFYENGS